MQRNDFMSIYSSEGFLDILKNQDGFKMIEPELTTAEVSVIIEHLLLRAICDVYTDSVLIFYPYAVATEISDTIYARCGEAIRGEIKRVMRYTNMPKKALIKAIITNKIFILSMTIIDKDYQYDTIGL